MAQQIQFIYLTQSEYDALNPKNAGRIYFTSDTHRIYKGSDLYAATTFDQLNFSAITASSITVDGSAVALEGHTHPASDITGLEAAISGFASVGHTHSELSGITATSITKSGNITASVGTFHDINVTGTATFSATSIAATSVTVGGSAVSLEGHGHSIADVDGLENALSGFASSGHTHSELSGITATSITKETGTFTNLVVANASITAASIVASGAQVNGSLSASTVTANTGTFENLVVANASLDATQVIASSVSVAGPITASTITANVGTFGDIVVSGSASFSALTLTVTSMFVNGSAVSLEGHGHSMADVDGLEAALSGFASTGHTHSQYAASNHTHDELSGLTSTSISKTNASFATLTASTGTFNTVTTSDLNMTNLTIASASASNMTVTNLSVTGSMLYNNKEVATQEYVQ